MKRILLVILLGLMSAAAANAQLVLQKGTWSAGIHFGHFKMDSDNSEVLLMVNPINASGSISSVSPFVEYTYRDDRSAGIKFQYLAASVLLDDVTIDLPSDGMTFNLSNLSTTTKRFSVFAYHRSYFALDSRSRVGLVAEESLSYSGTRSEGDKVNPDKKYATSNKVNLAFSPGLVFFVMNNVSASFTLSIANMSYGMTRCYTDGTMVGTRSKFDARLGVDITGMNFGVAYHF